MKTARSYEQGRPVDNLWCLMDVWVTQYVLVLSHINLHVVIIVRGHSMNVLCSYHSYLDTSWLSLDVRVAPHTPVSEYLVYHSYLDTPGLSLDVQLAPQTPCVRVSCVPQLLEHSRTISGCPTCPTHTRGSAEYLQGTRGGWKSWGCTFSATVWGRSLNSGNW